MSAVLFGVGGLGEVIRQWRQTHVVTVIESFGDEPSNADLAEVVEEGTDLLGGLLGGPVDVVGVLVEESEKELFASRAVAALAGWAGPAGEVFNGLVDLGRLVDA